MFKAFESLVHPYPEQTPETPPTTLFAFLWRCTDGLRPYILAMTLLTAGIGAFEALLFSMLGSVVDWLARRSATPSGKPSAATCCCSARFCWPVR